MGVVVVFATGTAPGQADAGGLPDIAITHGRNKAKGAIEVEIAVHIENEGVAPTGPFEVGLQANGVHLTPRLVDDLAPGETADLHWKFPFAGPELDDYEHADIRDRVLESDGTNNAAGDFDFFCEG